MRKMKQVFKTILALALVLALLPVYNVSAGRSNLQLDEETKALIQADYLEVHKAANPDDSYVQAMTAEDILILDYYGTYSDYEVVQIYFKDVETALEDIEVRICGYMFNMNASLAPYFLAYKDSEFITVKDAYEHGLLSRSNISGIAWKYGAKWKSFDPGEELAKDMCEAFRQYLEESRGGYDTDLGDLQVEEYCGNFGGYDIAQMGFTGWVVTTDIGTVRIAGFVFSFASGAYPQYFLAYKDGEMLLVKDAYEQGLLSKEDIINLAIVRGDAIHPDKCVEHELEYIGGRYGATAVSQGWRGDLSCTKCFTMIEESKYLPTLSHTRYTDIRPNSWYCKCVDYCDQNGIMVGVDADKFDPARRITRGEFVAALHRLAGTPEFTKASTFTDVAPESFYADAVAWGVENGIVYGTTETTYSPDLPITREDIACLVARYAEAIEADFLHDDEFHPLPDMDITDLSDYARESYTIVCSEGIMVGNANGMFYPKNKATRAEVASVFMNLHEKLIDPEQAYIQVGEGEDAWISHLQEREAELFRSLLDMKGETWKEALRCECAGECQLVLDGVRYWIDWEDFTHQIKYTEIYGGVSGAIETEDAEVLNELSAMLWTYKFVYELTK